MRKSVAFISALVLAIMCLLGSVSFAETKDLEYVKLKYVNFGDKPTEGNFDDVWAKLNEILLRELNCEVEVIWLGAESRQKIALMYASNEVFDFGFTSSWFEYAGDANKNAFYEITPEDIQTYMPRLAASYPETQWDVAKVGGKIFCVPSYYKSIMGHAEALIRGDLREKYGMEPITTVEDMIKYMKLVAENEDSMYAITGECISARCYEALSYNGLQLLDSNNKLFFYANDDSHKLYNFFFTEEFEELCKQQRELYLSGCWAADAIADITADDQDNFRVGMSAVLFHNVDTLNAMAKTVSKDHPEWKVELVGLKTNVPHPMGIGLGDGTIINRLSQNPERAMMAIDMMLGDPECNHLLTNGLESVNYGLNEQGQLTSEGYEGYIAGCNWNWTNSNNAFENAAEYPGYLDMKNALLGNAITNPVAKFVFDQTGFETEVAATAAVVSEYERALVFGMVEDIDSYIADFRTKLEAAGALKIVDEAQRQLDESLTK